NFQGTAVVPPNSPYDESVSANSSFHKSVILPGNVPIAGGREPILDPLNWQSEYKSLRLIHAYILETVRGTLRLHNNAHPHVPYRCQFSNVPSISHLQLRRRNQRRQATPGKRRS